MEVIRSLNNKRIKELSKLLIKKYRDEDDRFLVEGEHLVEEAHKAGLLLEVYKCEDCDLDYDVDTTLVTYDVLKKLTNSKNPQKVVGVVKKLADGKMGDRVIVLDNLQDPGNLGTIIRSSVAFNIDTIVLSESTVDLYNDKVVRASEGMMFHINIIKRDIDRLIDELHEKGYIILGTKVDGGTEINDIQKNLKYAIVVGNEGAGVRKSILDKCDKYLYIPMNNNCESLNVGVATSIIMYELNK
jgi:TrmH family RNA methyltransferase